MYDIVSEVTHDAAGERGHIIQWPTNKTYLNNALPKECEKTNFSILYLQCLNVQPDIAL